MEFILNELSIHGQFGSAREFYASLRGLLELRERIEREGLPLRSPRALVKRPVNTGLDVRRALSQWPDRNLRVLLLAWLQNKGPFWDDGRQHGLDDWFECPSGTIVTDSGLAEAATLEAHGQPCDLVSLAPSDWMRTPITVEWVRGEMDRRPVPLVNHWEGTSLAVRLEGQQKPLASWEDLAAWGRRACPRLALVEDVVKPLAGHPFVPAAARQFQERLRTLDRLKASFGPDGSLNQEGKQILQDHFVGERAWFTDSSDGEKVEFRSKMTFPDPALPGERIFCPWHGKVKSGNEMRMHFTHPITRDKPLYVVYIGPKLTKR